MLEDSLGFYTYNYNVLKNRSWLFKVAKYFGINFELSTFPKNPKVYILRLNLYAIRVYFSVSVGLAKNFSGAFSATLGKSSASISYNLGLGTNYALAFTYTLSWSGLSKSISLVWCSANDGVFVSLNAEFYISHLCTAVALAAAIAFSPQFAPAVASIYVKSQAAITSMMLGLAQIVRLAYSY